MNIYKYAKDATRNRININLVQDLYFIGYHKPVQRLLVIHWLSWYLTFKRMGLDEDAKRNLHYVMQELALFKHCED